MKSLGQLGILKLLSANKLGFSLHLNYWRPSVIQQRANESNKVHGSPHLRGLLQEQPLSWMGWEKAHVLAPVQGPFKSHSSLAYVKHSSTDIINRHKHFKAAHSQQYFPWFQHAQLAGHTQSWDLQSPFFPPWPQGRGEFWNLCAEG